MTQKYMFQSFEANNSQVIKSLTSAHLPEPKTGMRLKIGFSPIMILSLIFATSLNASENISESTSAAKHNFVVK